MSDNARHTPEGKSFEALYAELTPALLAWLALRVGGPRAPSGAAKLGRVDPDDALQEIWSRALSLEHDGRRGSAPFRPWIFRVAKNVLLEELRSVARDDGRLGASAALRHLENLPDSVTSVSQRMARDEGLARFLDEASALSEEDRDLLVHCGLEGLDARQVGERLGLTRDAVTKRWQRLRKQLRERSAPTIELLLV